MSCSVILTLCCNKHYLTPHLTLVLFNLLVRKGIARGLKQRIVIICHAIYYFVIYKEDFIVP